MEADKLNQLIAFVGGMLGALLLFLKSIGIDFAWFTDESINTFIHWLTSLVPLVLIGYGIYKNQYLLSEKAKKQEEVLKDRGLK